MLPLLEKLLSVKKPASGLPKSLLAQYEATGIASGFRVEPLEKGILFIGKTVTVALKLEFGNRWEFFNTITSLRETPADIKVLASSSNVKSISMEAVYTVLKKKLQEKTRWVLVDIEGKKEPMFLNFSLSDLGEKAPARLKEKAESGKKPGTPRERGMQREPLQQKPSQPAPAQEERVVPPVQGPAAAPAQPKEEGPRPQKKSPFAFLGSLPFFGQKKKGSALPPKPKEEAKEKDALQGQKIRELQKGKESGGREPVLMKKSKNYGMQPADAKPRKKKIYGKRAKKRE